jgi:hypothetical protein
MGDAILAIKAFRRKKQSAKNPTRIDCDSAFSLAGAAILWAGLSKDLKLLSEPCVVLRPIFSKNEAHARLKRWKQRRRKSRQKSLESIEVIVNKAKRL